MLPNKLSASYPQCYSWMAETLTWTSRTTAICHMARTKQTTFYLVIANFGALSSRLKITFRNLGVLSDNNSKFDKLTAWWKTVIGYVFQPTKMKPFLNHADLKKKTIRAFISSWIDYCNALYVVVSQSAHSRLQLVQKPPARILTNTTQRQHITPVLKINAQKSEGWLLPAAVCTFNLKQLNLYSHHDSTWAAAPLCSHFPSHVQTLLHSVVTHSCCTSPATQLSHQHFSLPQILSDQRTQ